MCSNKGVRWPIFLSLKKVFVSQFEIYILFLNIFAHLFTLWGVNKCGVNVFRRHRSQWIRAGRAMGPRAPKEADAIQAMLIRTGVARRPPPPRRGGVVLIPIVRGTGITESAPPLGFPPPGAFFRAFFFLHKKLHSHKIYMSHWNSCQYFPSQVVRV